MIPCDVCEYRATVPSKLAVHKEIHRADKPYLCDICHKVGSSPLIFKSSLQQLSSWAAYHHWQHALYWLFLVVIKGLCYDDNFWLLYLFFSMLMQGFKQQSQLKNHSLVHIAGMDIKEKESMSGRHWFVQAECNICKRTFANQKSLQSHVEAVHDKVSAQYLKYLKYLKYHNYYFNILQYYYEESLWSVLKFSQSFLKLQVKPFACKFCGHTAARKAMMQLHMRTHTGEKPFKLVCYCQHLKIATIPLKCFFSTLLQTSCFSWRVAK